MPRMADETNAISLRRLQELLFYDPATGFFHWKVKRNSHGGGVNVGTVAGTIDTYGYRMIGIDGFSYMAHRLAWFYMRGEWPKGEIDHCNLCPDDNWLDNLRAATCRTFQRANQNVRRDSISGLKGVQRTPEGKWIARVTSHGIVYRLGRFENPQDAHAAYVKKAQELFGEFARP